MQGKENTLPLDREFETTPEAIPNPGDELLQPPLGAANPSPWEAALPARAAQRGRCQKKVVSAEKAPARRKSSRVSTLYMRCGSALE